MLTRPAMLSKKLALLCLVVSLSCGGTTPTPAPMTLEQRKDQLEARLDALAARGGLRLDPELAAHYERAREPIVALQRGELERAERLASHALEDDPDNPYLHLVAGTADVSLAFVPLWKHYNHFEIYFEALELAMKLPRDMRAGILEAAGEHAMGAGRRDFEQVDWAGLAGAMARVRRGFDDADVHLARAQEAEGIQLLLCPECWQVDWNDDGTIDRQDDLWRVAYDSSGRPMDASRDGTVYRFDRSDVVWLRAMISFQSAAADLLGAYDLSPLSELARGEASVTLRLIDAERVHSAEQHILEGLALSRRNRELVLAERDDYLEWLAAPNQRSTHFPDQLSQAGFDAWPVVSGQLVTLVDGDSTIPIDALVYVLSESAWQDGTEDRAIDLAGFFDAPGDIVVDLDLLERVWEGRRIDDLNLLLATASSRHVVDAGSDLGVFRLWTDSIDDLDRERPGNREASSRYLVRRRILFVN